MEKLNNLFKKKNKSSENIENARENLKSMLWLSEEELAKLSEEDLTELSGGEEEKEYPDEKDAIENFDEDNAVEWNGRFNTSLLNSIISDSVLRYALENGHFEFLRKVKNGKITDEEYESMKKEMKENWWEKMKFEGSLLQQISEDYIYYLALEKVDEKMLHWLLYHTLTANYKYDVFAPKNWVDDIMQLMWWWVAAMHYHQWISQRLWK